MESTKTVVSPVSFELSAAEANAMFSAPAKQLRLLLGVFGANVALNLVLGVLETGIVRPRHADPLLASVHLLTAAMFAAAIFAFWRRTRPRKGRSLAVSFDDDGMHLAEGGRRPRTVPWSAIRSVGDVSAVLVVRYGIWRSAIIPRRAYADQGAALWLLLEQRLIGRRSLHRRTDARIIVNTAR